MTNRFALTWHFNGFSNISLGVSLCLKPLNLEIHIPSGFFRIGWQKEKKLFNFSSQHRIRLANLGLVK